MGCGATICGAPAQSPTIGIVSLKSTYLLRMLEPKIRPNNYLLSKREVEKFVQKMEINGQMYIIKPQESIKKGKRVSMTLMEKWRVILYGLDVDFQQYVNCVGYTEVVKQRGGKDDNENVGLPDEFPHPCFQQIQKDLDRTFQLPQLKRESFSKILKCIACRFPKMGYTQGINFIVGYFLIVGFSQSDTFWLFCHMALNRRYMLLGLFQDGFPLSKVYITVFKNMLKRLLPSLHTHLYQSLILEDSLWIFKWFITYYLYSFPIQVCKYVWDLVILLGGIGLIYFAIGMATYLELMLMEMNDQCEVCQFLAELKELDGFNRYVKVQEVLRIAYGVSMEIRDLEGIQISNGGVYSKYFVQYWTRQINNRNDRNQDRHSNNPENTGSIVLASSQEKMSNIPHLFANPTLKTTELQPKQSRNISNQRIEKLSLQIQEDTGKDLLTEWYGQLSNERHQFERMGGLSHYKSNRISIGGQNRSLGRKEQSVTEIDAQEKISERKGKRSVQNNIENLIWTSNQKTERFSMQQNEGESRSYKQKQKAGTTIIHQSSHRNIHKRHFVSSKINQIWDEQQDIANDSQDNITDMESTRQIPGIPSVKIDLGSYFDDNRQLESEYKDDDWHEKASEGGVRKRSGSKIGEKGVEHKIGYGQNQCISASMIQSAGNLQDGRSRNKMKTEEGKQITNKNNMDQSNSVISVPLPVLVAVPYKATLTAFDKNASMGNGGLTQNNQGSDTSSQNNYKGSRLAMAGKNIMSSISISNASISGKSSNSSHQNYNNSGNSNHYNQNKDSDERKQKNNRVNININVNVNVNVNNYAFGNGMNSGDYQQDYTKRRQSKKYYANQKQSKQQYKGRKQDSLSEDKYSMDLQPCKHPGIRQKLSDYNVKAELQQSVSRNPSLLIDSLSEIEAEKKRISNYKGWGIDSFYESQDMPKITHTASKHSMRSEAQIYDGGQLFKKKNRIAGRVGGGFDIGGQGLEGYVDERRSYNHFGQKNSIFYPVRDDRKDAIIANNTQKKGQYPGSITNENMDSQFADSNMNKLDHQQSCESILLVGQSEEGHENSSRSASRSRRTRMDLGFEIESAK